MPLIETSYQADFPFTALLYAKDKGLFQSSGWLSQGKESLVWPFRRLAVDGGEEQPQSICITQRHRFA